MISLLITVLKLIILLGFLVIIHEGGHFCIAKLCKVKVNEFSIGFGKLLWKKQGKETMYSIRAVPLGGFVRMEGEDEKSDHERAFSKASIPKRLAIVLAGPIVNIVFGIAVYAIMFGVHESIELISALVESVKMLLTGKIGLESMVGPVGVGTILSQTSGIRDFFTMLTLISVSLGITNLLPIPLLDGGRCVFLLVEAIRRKPLKKETEAYIQVVGFALMMALAFIVMYQDVSRLITLKN